MKKCWIYVFGSEYDEKQGFSSEEGKQDIENEQH